MLLGASGRDRDRGWSRDLLQLDALESEGTLRRAWLASYLEWFLGKV